MAAEYEVNIKINSQQVERQLQDIDKIVSNIGKPKGGGSRKKSGIAGLLPSTQELKAADRGIVQLIDRFAQRKERAIARSNALNKVELRLNKQLVDQARKRVRLQGAADGAMQGKGRMAAENIDTRVRVQEKKLKLVNKVNELEAKGLGVQKFRNQIEKISTQQSARRFASAEKEIRLLRKMLEIDQSRAKILRSESQNLRSSPIRGGLGFPGSPGFLAGATVSGTPFGPAGNFPQRLGAGGARLPVRGGKGIAGSPAQMEAIKKLEMAEIRAAKNAHFAKLRLIQKRQKIRMDNIDKELAKDVRALEVFDKKLAASDRLNAGLTGQTSPIRGGIFQKGSPNQKRFEGVALGAGFPALFGGGPGSIIGGGLGGLTGSFGAQIGLSAIGQQVDAFIASVARVGTALTSATGTVEMFREKNLFSSDAVKEHAFQLEEQGKMQELATLLTKDLASQIGKNAVENFQALGGELKEFLGTVNQLFLSVQGFVAGPLAKLLSAINTVLGGVSTDVQFGSLRESLTGDAAAQFEAIVAETRGTRELTSQERQRAISQQRSTDPVEGRLTTAVKEAILKDPRIAKLRQTINVTGQTTLDDTLSFKPSRSKTDTERAAAVLKSAQEKLQIMQQEGSLAKELKRLDFDRAAEIDKINKLESATTEERKAAITATDKLFDARKGEVIGKALSEDLEKAIKLKEAQEDVLRPLEDQRRLLDGKLKGNEEEVRLQLEIEKILRSVEGLNRQDVEDALRKNAALEEQVKQVERLEQLYQQVGSAIENGIVNGIMSAIDGSKSLGESLSGILKQLGGMFLKAGIGSFGIGGQAGSGLLGLLPFAEGGYVSGPTPALIGEGGQGEYVIPESKMRESMSRYSRGSRGDSVIPTSGGGTGDSGGGTAVAAPIDVRYTVERINSVDYVTADQFQSGLQSAAAQGAQRGEQNTLKRLQMSGSTRKRLGL